MVFRALKLHSQVRLKRPRGAKRSSPHLPNLLQLERLWLLLLVFKGWIFFKRRQLRLVQPLHCRAEETEAQRVGLSLDVSHVQHPHDAHTWFKLPLMVSGKS